jgi:hypothetical protein
MEAPVILLLRRVTVAAELPSTPRDGSAQLALTRHPNGRTADAISPPT